MEMNTRFNYYDILEINPQSNQHEVTDAYNRARQTYSSDNPALYTIFTENEAREYLRMVEEAYSVLGNRALRNLYDQKLGRGIKEMEQLSYEVLLHESKVHQKPAELPKVGRLRPEYSIDDSVETLIRNTTHIDGHFLKQVREYKNVSLEQLSSITKITPFYLSALERMDPQSLPATVFVRGYIIQISRYLGLEEKKVVDSYMKLFRETLANTAAANQQA